MIGVVRIHVHPRHRACACRRRERTGCAQRNSVSRSILTLQNLPFYTAPIFAYNFAYCRSGVSARFSREFASPRAVCIYPKESLRRMEQLKLSSQDRAPDQNSFSPTLDRASAEGSGTLRTVSGVIISKRVVIPPEAKRRAQIAPPPPPPFARLAAQTSQPPFASNPEVIEPSHSTATVVETKSQAARIEIPARPLSSFAPVAPPRSSRAPMIALGLVAIFLLIAVIIALAISQGLIPNFLVR